MKNVLALPKVVFVTGTDTDVGKTITTAALAAVFAQVGSVAIYKPVQTGVEAGEAGDTAEVARLAGVQNTFEGARYSAPMAPVAAAEKENRELPSLASHVRNVVELSQRFDRVLVEGSGGLLVELDGAGGTLADLAAGFALAAGNGTASESGVVLVARAGLGTLNHAALTIEALQTRGLDLVGVVLGSVPAIPNVVERSNQEVFAASRNKLLAQVPAGVAKMQAKAFCEAAGLWFEPEAVWSTPRS
ncbi:dethiobiotin synthase [Renibacterium salmoninarum]|nr:dethiobiotin synthase [Renibacterium salmoninarum]